MCIRDSDIANWHMDMARIDRLCFLAVDSTPCEDASTEIYQELHGTGTRAAYVYIKGTRLLTNAPIHHAMARNARCTCYLLAALYDDPQVPGISP